MLVSWKVSAVLLFMKGDVLLLCVVRQFSGVSFAVVTGFTVVVQKAIIVLLQSMAGVVFSTSSLTARSGVAR